MKTRFNVMLDKENVDGLDRMLKATKYNRSSWLDEVIEEAVKSNSLIVENKKLAHEQLSEVMKILNRLASKLK